jgi:hypothetical protein
MCQESESHTIRDADLSLSPWQEFYPTTAATILQPLLLFDEYLPVAVNML